jgi:dTDP-4-amino-4,6-dideoxygalactose transaminase
MIPLFDIQAQYRSIRHELEPAIIGVLESGQYILGPEVARFEEAFAAYCGTGACVGVNSGTSALHLALLAAGVGPGDEVIAPAMTFIATASAIDYAGAKPVFAEIDPATWTVTAETIKSKITSRTRAVIPVHLHGRMAEMESIAALAAKHGLTVIEDAAQAHGARRRGRSPGAHSSMACFSFYAGKNLGACGEGGAVTSDDPALVKRLRILRDWGAEKKYHHTLKGYNYRLEGIQGAVLGVKLRHLEKWTDERRAVAARYSAAFAAAGLPHPAPEEAGERHVYHVYAIRTPERDRVLADLHAGGVGAGIHYPIPVHLQLAFAELGYRRGDLSVTEKLADETLSLPIFPGMSDRQVGTVIDAVLGATKRV